MSDGTLQYTVQAGDSCIFLRDVMKHRFRLSRSLLNQLKAQQRIMVNGRFTRTDYRLQAGDLVTIDVELDEECGLPAFYLPLNICYEDQDYLVVDKPPGLKIHPSGDPDEVTLAGAVAYYWKSNGRNCRFRPINRLDKDTSGLVLVGKSQYAHQAVYQQQRKGAVSRSYLAVVEGVVGPDQGVIDLPIIHHEPHVSAARCVAAEGRQALTSFAVIRRFASHSLLSLVLGTGRTHQIRVHLSHYGHPVCGDTLYGSPSLFINRQALHAARLIFDHPRSGQRIELQSPLPDDMLNLLKNIGNQV